MIVWLTCGFSSTVLDAEGENLWSVLSALSERLDARTRSLPITLEWDIEAAGDIHLPPRDMLQAARIVQEAVSNALAPRRCQRHLDSRSR